MRAAFLRHATSRLDGRIASFTSFGGASLDHGGFWLRSRAKLRPRSIAQLVRQMAGSWYMTALEIPGVPLVGWLVAGRRRGHDRRTVVTGANM